MKVKLIAGMALVVVVMGAVVSQGNQNREAEEAGFESHAERLRAEQAGFTDAVAWREARDAEEVLAAEQRAAAAAAAEQERVREAAACRQSLECWFGEHRIRAESRCKGQIERLARYEVEWTDGWVDPMFTRGRWEDEEAGVLVFVGDRVRFQNGFGASANMTYSCTFDPSDERVVAVDAWEGRLPE